MTPPIKRKIIISGIKALADELGVTQQHLSGVLKGRRRGSEELVAKLLERGIRPKRLVAKSRQWS